MIKVFVLSMKLDLNTRNKIFYFLNKRLILI